MNEKIWIAIITGILILGGLIVFVGPKIGIPLSVVSQGFSTLSLSSISTTSNDPTLGGQTWFLTVSQNGASQTAYIDNSATLKDDQTGATSNPTTISISLDKNYLTYPIQSQGIYIKTISYTTTTWNPFGSLGGCNPTVWNNYVVSGGIPYVSKVWCYNFSNVGIYGTLGNANQNFQSTISVQGSGGSDSCTISNTGANSCYSNYGNVYASWTGSLISGQSPPEPGLNIVAVYNTATGGWKTASYSQYTTYNNYASGGFQSCISTTSTLSNSCFDNYASYSSTFMNGYPFTSPGGQQAYYTAISNQPNFRIDLPTQFSFPVITMRIKAALVGINLAVGKPKILSASEQAFTTGQTGNVAVTVENVGTAAGSFNVGMTCTSGFLQTGNSLTISSLAPNSQQTVYIPIESNVVSGTNTGTCTVTATDINNPNNYDTKTVSVSSNAIQICTEGQVLTNGNLIQQCQNNAWVTIKVCNPDNETAQLTSSGAECVPKGGGGGGNCGFLGLGCLFSKGGFFDNLFSSIGNIFTGVFNFIKLLILIAGIAGGLFAFGFVDGLLNKIEALRQNRWIPILISLAAGVFAFMLVENTWWIFLILFAAYIAIKIMFPESALIGRVLRR